MKPWRPTSPVFGNAEPVERPDDLPLTAPVLSIDGRTWRNNGALYVPRWVSHLSALRPDRSQEQWHEYFHSSRSTGFGGVRVFAGFLGWANQEAAGARARLPAYLDLATDYGLVVHVAALNGTADSNYDIEHHVREIGAITRGRANVVREVANEIGHSSQRVTLQQCLELGLRHFAGDLWTVGAPLGMDEPQRIDPDDEDSPLYWPAAGAPFNVSHLDRGRDFWNQCRRVREIYAIVEETGRPSLDNEPLGADERDGSETGKQRSNAPAFFATLGALDRAFPGVGGVHHSQAGLDAVLPGPAQQACADAYVAAQRAIAAVLGEDVPSYRNSDGAGSPVGRYADDDFGRHITRHYSFIAGDKGVTVAIGEADGLDVPWANGWRQVAERYRVTARDGKSLVVREVAR